MIACMGGWCEWREHCPHYMAPVHEGVPPAENLCMLIERRELVTAVAATIAGRRRRRNTARAMRRSKAASAARMASSAAASEDHEESLQVIRAHRRIGEWERGASGLLAPASPWDGLLP